MKSLLCVSLLSLLSVSTYASCLDQISLDYKVIGRTQFLLSEGGSALISAGLISSSFPIGGALSELGLSSTSLAALTELMVNDEVEIGRTALLLEQAMERDGLLLRYVTWDLNRLLKANGQVELSRESVGEMIELLDESTLICSTRRGNLEIIPVRVMPLTLFNYINRPIQSAVKDLWKKLVR